MYMSEICKSIATFSPLGIPSSPAPYQTCTANSANPASRPMNAISDIPFSSHPLFHPHRKYPYNEEDRFQKKRTAAESNRDFWIVEARMLNESNMKNFPPAPCGRTVMLIKSRKREDKIWGVEFGFG
jgi:hypothetical protein